MSTTHANAETDAPTTEDTTDAATADESRPGASVDVPEEINSPRAKLVYLYLATHGAVTEDRLCDGLEMKRITLYSIVQTLDRAGLVSREGDRYVLA